MVDARYSEALERQIEMLRYTEQQPGQLGDAPLMRRNVDVHRGRLMVHETLTRATPFYWSAELCDLLHTAADVLPFDAKLPSDALPCMAGFWWFARPFSVPCSVHHDKIDEITALSWTNANFDRPVSYDGLDTPGIWWTAYARTPNRWQGVPRSNDYLPFEVESHDWIWSRVDQAKDDLVAEAREVEPLSRLVVAGLLLINQRILQASAHRADRVARRNVERAQMDHDPVIRVVELRRKEYERHDSDDHADVEWSCRWIVRGHWHRYRTIDGLQPRWVSPYVKGPPDAPLKKPRAEVFAVVR